MSKFESLVCQQMWKNCIIFRRQGPHASKDVRKMSHSPSPRATHVADFVNNVRRRNRRHALVCPDPIKGGREWALLYFGVLSMELWGRGSVTLCLSCEKHGKNQVINSWEKASKVSKQSSFSKFGTYKFSQFGFSKFLRSLDHQKNLQYLYPQLTGDNSSSCEWLFLKNVWISSDHHAVNCS